MLCGSLSAKLPAHVLTDLADYKLLLQARRDKEVLTNVNTKQLPTPKEVDLLFHPSTLLEAEKQRAMNPAYSRADTSEDERPELFPKFLWRYVMDPQRPLVK